MTHRTHDSKTGAMMAVPMQEATPFRPSRPPPPPARSTFAPPPMPRPRQQPSPPPAPSGAPYASTPPPTHSHMPPATPAPTWSPPPRAIQPPSPLRDAWAPVEDTYAPPQEAAEPSREPEPAPASVRRTFAHELLWKDDAPDALRRARAWASPARGRPRGLVPRLGRAALREPRPRPNDWWLEGRTASVASLTTETSLLDGDGAALACPAVVLRGQLELATSPGDELLALRAALRHLERRHKAIREALELTADIEIDDLTPPSVVKAGIEELLRGGASAGMPPDVLRNTARQGLIRARRFREIDLLGGDHVVCWWRDDEGSEPQIAYLPVSATRALPLLGRFPARAVVTVLPRQDPEEPNRLALRIHALSRCLTAEELEDGRARSQAG